MSSLEIRRRATDYGTESDKRTCAFYTKTGTCRHGDTCTRAHDKPQYSRVVLIQHMYLPPEEEGADEQAAFEDFAEDVLDEASKFGPIKELVVTANVYKHMLGNCYISFVHDSSAAELVQKWTGRFYNGLVLKPELSPISTNLEEARCKQYDKASCDRGAECSFVHVRPMPHWLRMRLYEPESYFDLVHVDPALASLKDEMYPDHMSTRFLKPEDEFNNRNSNGQREIHTSAPTRILVESFVNGAFEGLNGAPTTTIASSSTGYVANDGLQNNPLNPFSPSGMMGTDNSSFVEADGDKF